MRALVIVDVQNDFMPDGALPVPEGYEVIPVINRLIAKFDLVVATQDWHPQNHGSFASNHQGEEAGNVIELDGLEQVLWPDHCVQGTEGAAFVNTLETRPVEAIFRKGTESHIDTYSGFFDNGHRKATGLGAFLRGKEVDELWVAGVATDYCVKATALDSRELGFETFLVEDGCRGVELNEGDVEAALAEMRDVGVHIKRSSDV